MDNANLVQNEEYSDNSDAILRSSTQVNQVESEKECTLSQPSELMPYEKQQNVIQQLHSLTNIALNFNQQQFISDDLSSLTNKPIKSQNQEYPKCITDYRTTFTKTHYTYLYKQIRELYIHTRVLDVYFLVGRQYIGAHFCILAYASPMLKSLLLQVTGDSMFISVPDISSLALENLIHFLYNGSLKHNAINFEEVAEAAKYLGMEEVISLLQKYYLYIESKENSTSLLSSREKILEKDSQPGDDGFENSNIGRSNNLEEILHQRLTAKKHQQSEAHCSSTMGSGILSELLTKPDYNRSTTRLQSSQPSNYNQSNAPLNLSKTKNISMYNSASYPRLLNQSFNLGCAGTIPEPNNYYFSGDSAAHNISPQATNSSLLNSCTTTFTYGFLDGNEFGTSSANFKENSSNSKRKLPQKDIPNSQLIGEQLTSMPHYGSSSQQSIPFYNPNLLKELCIPIKANHPFPKYHNFNRLDTLQNFGLSTLNLKGIFPNLYMASTNDVINGSEEASSSTDQNVPPDDTVIPLSPNRQNQTALNLSSQNKDQLHNTISETTEIGVKHGINKKTKVTDSEKTEFKVCSSPSSITSRSSPLLPFSEDSMSLAQDCKNTIESSHNDHADNDFQTAPSSLSSTFVLNNPIHMSNFNSLTTTPLTSYDLLKGFPFNHYGLPFTVPSNVSNSMKQSPIIKNISNEKLASSPIDLSNFPQVGLSQTFPSNANRKVNSENAEIDVVGSSNSLTSETSESADSNRENLQLQSSRKETKFHFKDSKPTTLECVEVIEESVSPEKIIVMQPKPPQPSVNMGRKRKGCGECVGCQVADDCGTCRFCLDKSKYGGPNRLKQVCLYKRCADLHNESNDARKKRRLLKRKKQMKCGVCNGCQTESDCGECYSCLYNNTGSQPPSRKKSCEMRLCEVEEAKAYLNVTKEPSPYSTDSLLSTSTGLGTTSVSDLESDSALKSKIKKAMKNKVLHPYRRDSPSKVRTKYYCGKCQGCTTTSPCGDCVYCEDMPKFGGRGRYRQKCIKQLCDSHPRLQALKNSNRSKPIDDPSIEESRQLIMFDVNNEKNTLNEYCETQLGEGDITKECSCETSVEAIKPESSHFNNLFHSISDHKMSDILSMPTNLEEVNFKPISKLHIKKCDEESSHWQIQRIPVNINKSHDIIQKDRASAMDLSIAINEVKMASSHERIDKNINFMVEMSDRKTKNPLQRKNPSFVKENILTISNNPVKKNNHDATRRESSVDEILSNEPTCNIEKQLIEKFEPTSHRDNPYFSSSRKVKVGRGRGKYSVGARGSRKRGRRRKVHRMIIDPEDHSDFEDGYAFENHMIFKEVVPHTHNNNQLVLRETMDLNMPKVELRNKGYSNICEQASTSNLHYHSSVAEQCNLSNSELHPKSSTKLYSDGIIYSTHENKLSVSSTKKSPQHMTSSNPLLSPVPLTLVNPLAAVDESPDSNETSVTLNLSRTKEFINNTFNRSQSYGFHVPDKNSYNAHISCASGEIKCEVKLNTHNRDENQNLGVKHGT